MRREQAPIAFLIANVRSWNHQQDDRHKHGGGIRDLH